MNIFQHHFFLHYDIQNDFNFPVADARAWLIQHRCAAMLESFPHKQTLEANEMKTLNFAP